MIILAFLFLRNNRKFNHTFRKNYIKIDISLIIMCILRWIFCWTNRTHTYIHAHIHTYIHTHTLLEGNTRNTLYKNTRPGRVWTVRTVARKSRSVIFFNDWFLAPDFCNTFGRSSGQLFPPNYKINRGSARRRASISRISQEVGGKISKTDISLLLANETNTNTRFFFSKFSYWT